MLNSKKNRRHEFLKTGKDMLTEFKKGIKNKSREKVKGLACRLSAEMLRMALNSPARMTLLSGRCEPHRRTASVATIGVTPGTLEDGEQVYDAISRTRHNKRYTPSEGS